MAIQRSDYVDALDANLAQFYQDGILRWPEEYSKVANVMNSNKASEVTSYASGFGTMPEKNEGVAASYDQVLAGIKTTFTHKTYAQGYEITEEAIEDNLRTAETFNKLPSALARSGIETVETTFFNLFNNGFTNTGFDGKVLFATDHPTLDGGTQSNRPSTQADLSVTSLTAGLTAMSKFTDERGLKRPLKAQTLLVPSDLWNIADELLRSEYKPFTGNNEVNAIQEKALQWMEGHYLTDTDAWFLLAPKDMHRLIFWWRIRLGALKRGTDFDTTNLKHLARMRFSVGYDHWIGTYGSAGA